MGTWLARVGGALVLTHRWRRGPWSRAPPGPVLVSPSQGSRTVTANSAWRRPEGRDDNVGSAPTPVPRLCLPGSGNEDAADISKECYLRCLQTADSFKGKG